MSDKEDIDPRNWQTLPPEMRQHVIKQAVVKPTHIEDDYNDDGKLTALEFEDTVLKVEDFQKGQFVEKNVMQILACKAFEQDMTYEALYGKNWVRFGKSNRQHAEALRYDYCLPPGHAYPLLTHVLITSRVDAEDWHKLMRYSDIMHVMPRLKHVELEFVEHRNASDDVRQAMQDAVQASGPLLFQAEKLTVTYREVGQIMDAIVPPTDADRHDYQDAALIFNNIELDLDDGEELEEGKEKVEELEEKRLWSDYVTEVETDENWALDDQIVEDSDRAWHKRIVRTTSSKIVVSG